MPGVLQNVREQIMNGVTTNFLMYKSSLVDIFRIRTKEAYIIGRIKYEQLEGGFYYIEPGPSSLEKYVPLDQTVFHSVDKTRLARFKITEAIDMVSIFMSGKLVYLHSFEYHDEYVLAKVRI